MVYFLLLGPSAVCGQTSMHHQVCGISALQVCRIASMVVRSYISQVQPQQYSHNSTVKNSKASAWGH